MSRIDELITQHAPRGVELKELGQVLRIKNGKDHKALGDGEVPVYGSGGILRYVDAAAANGPSVLIPRKGSLGNLFYVEGPFWVVDTIFRTEINAGLIEPRFLYHQLLKMKLGGLNQAGGVPSQTQSVLSALRIPVPPLEVQREIVRVLDEFTQLEADLEAQLEAELEARLSQYDIYRDRLLKFHGDEAVEWVPMGDLGTIFGGLTNKTKADFSGGNARYVAYTNVFRNIAVDLSRQDRVRIALGEKQRTLSRGDILFTGSSESASEVAMSSVITTEPKEPTYLNSFCIAFRPDERQLLDPNFSKHLFRSSELRRQLVATASGVTRFNVSKSRLAKVSVPVLDLERQRAIAVQLDVFEALAGGLNADIPAEIVARRKQFEHYRDKLLTFEGAV